MRLFPLRAVVRKLLPCALASLLVSQGTCAWAQAEPSLGELLRRLNDQDQLIRQLERRIQELEAPARTAPRQSPAPLATPSEPMLDVSLEGLRGRGTGPAAQANPSVPAARPAPTAGQVAQAPAAGQQTPASGQQTPASGQQAPSGEAPKQGATDVKQLAQQPSIFERKLTVEFGTSYARLDRRQLSLSGFYALDSIFLGNLSLDQVKGSTFTHDVTLRYGLLQSLSVDLQVPWAMRSNRYLSGGAQYDVKKLVESRLEASALGDVGVGLSWQIARESRGWADIVGSFRLRFPTGDPPFGIANVIVPDADGKPTSLKIPVRLPTGSGARSALLSVSVLKSYDPVVLYGNIGYTINDDGHFDDISAGSGQPGRVRLGNALSIGGGGVLAVNDTTAFSVGVSVMASRSTQTRIDGQSWSVVTGSSGHASVLSVGVTQALSRNWSMVTSLGVGLTTDAPNYTLSARFPYRF